MKAELKDIMECDRYQSLKDYQPENPDYFCIGIVLLIGIKGKAGYDTFYGEVCSFEKFSQLKGRQKTYEKRDIILIERYDYQIICDHINNIITSYDEPDWHALANQLNKHFAWEYEGYLE